MAVIQTQTLALSFSISKLCVIFSQQLVLVILRFLDSICLCFPSLAASKTFAYTWRFLLPNAHSFPFLNVSLTPSVALVMMSSLVICVPCIFQHLSSPCSAPSHLSESYQSFARTQDNLLLVTFANQPLQSVLMFPYVLQSCSRVLKHVTWGVRRFRFSTGSGLLSFADVSFLHL